MPRQLLKSRQLWVLFVLLFLVIPLPLGIVTSSTGAELASSGPEWKWFGGLRIAHLGLYKLILFRISTNHPAYLDSISGEHILVLSLVSFVLATLLVLLFARPNK